MSQSQMSKLYLPAKAGDVDALREFAQGCELEKQILGLVRPIENPMFGHRQPWWTGFSALAFARAGLWNDFVYAVDKDVDTDKFWEGGTR